MKKIIITALIIILLAFSIGCQPQDETVKLGVLLAFTGAGADWTDLERKAIELAIDDLKEEGINVDVVYEDTALDPKVAVNGYNKLVNVDKVQGIVGGFGSGESLAVAPLAKEQQITMISPISNAVELSEAGEYFFRTVVSLQVSAQRLAEYYKENTGDKAAILYINNGWGKSLKDETVKEFEKAEIEVVASEEINPGDVDMKTQLLKIQEQEFDGLIIIAYPIEGANAVKQVKELGIETQIYGGDAFESEAFIETTGDASEGVILVRPQEDPELNFANKFKERFDADPGLGADRAYDAFMILARAVSQSKTKEEIKDNVMKIGQNYKGVSGLITFDENGDIATTPIVLKQIKNGEFVQIKKYT